MTLPPDLEQFVADAVAAGDFRVSTDVFAAGVRLLLEQRAARAAFVRSLEEAEAEADRDGWLSLDGFMAEADAIIAGRPKAGCPKAGCPSRLGSLRGRETSSTERCDTWTTRLRVSGCGARSKMPHGGSAEIL